MVETLRLLQLIEETEIAGKVSTGQDMRGDDDINSLWSIKYSEQGGKESNSTKRNNFLIYERRGQFAKRPTLLIGGVHLNWRGFFSLSPPTRLCRCEVGQSIRKVNRANVLWNRPCVDV